MIIQPLRECEFCTMEAARECTDPICRARGYGEPITELLGLPCEHDSGVRCAECVARGGERT